jgi:hypothetical protein
VNVGRFDDPPFLPPLLEAIAIPAVTPQHSIAGQWNLSETDGLYSREAWRCARTVPH